VSHFNHLGLAWIDLFELIYLHEFCETVWEDL